MIDEQGKWEREVEERQRKEVLRLIKELDKPEGRVNRRKLLRRIRNMQGVDA